MTSLEALNRAPFLKGRRIAALAAYAAGAWLLWANVQPAVALYPAAQAFRGTSACRAERLLDRSARAGAGDVCTIETIRFNEKFRSDTDDGRSLVLLARTGAGETLRLALPRGKRGAQFGGSLVPGATLYLQRYAARTGSPGAPIRLAHARQVLAIGATPVVQFAFAAARALAGLVLVLIGLQLRPRPSTRADR